MDSPCHLIPVIPALCTLYSALCTLHSELCTLHSALCTLQFSSESNFRGNTAGGSGGGVSIAGSMQSILLNSKWLRNKAGTYGGAVQATRVYRFTIDGGTFDANHGVKVSPAQFILFLQRTLFVLL